MITFSIIGAIPALVLARLTTKSEGVNAYDISIDFNPFKLSLEDNNASTGDKI